MKSQQVCVLLLAFVFAGASGASLHSVSYSVEVPETRDQKQAEESTVDGVTRGSYQYLRPDGVLQVVRYTVTKEGGYQAEVEERPGFAPIVVQETEAAQPQLESVEVLPAEEEPKAVLPPTLFEVPSVPSVAPVKQVSPIITASNLPLLGVPAPAAAPAFINAAAPVVSNLPLATVPNTPVFTQVKEAAPVFSNLPLPNLPVAPVFTGAQAFSVPTVPAIAQALASAGEQDVSSIDFKSPIVTFQSPHVSYTYFERV